MSATSRPATAQAVIPSKPKMLLNQADLYPASFACRTLSTAASIVPPPPPIPMRMRRR
jgi:hypothetical protein